MKAVCVTEPRTVNIVERDVPLAAPGEVRLRVRVAGITASDRQVYNGANPAVKYPFVAGRNFAGEIAALGSAVEGFRLGDRVVVDPVVGCGHCDACLAGRSNVCADLRILGIHLPGGMAEYVSVPAVNAHVVPKDWLWERAAMVEPFSIAANVLSRTDCEARDRVLILGAGPVGLSVLAAARHLGARVAVADVLEARLSFAVSCGADAAFNMNDDDFDRKILDWTGGKGVTLSVDVVSLPDFFSRLLKLAAPRGRLAHMSLAEKPVEILPAAITKKELTIVGSRLNGGMFPRVIEWFSTAAFVPENMVSHSFPYTEAQDAFSLLEESPVNTRQVLLTF